MADLQPEELQALARALAMQDPMRLINQQYPSGQRGAPGGEIRSRNLSGDEKVADMVSATGLDYQRSKSIAEALGLVVPAAAAHDAAAGIAKVGSEPMSPAETFGTTMAAGLMAHPLTRRLTTGQRVITNLGGALATSGALSGDVDPITAGSFVAGAYGGQAAGKAVERAGGAAVGALRDWADVRTPNAAGVVGSRAPNEVSGIGGPSLPPVNPGRDLSYKMQDEISAAQTPRLPYEPDAWRSQPYHEFSAGPTPRSVVRREVDPQTVADRQQFREGHIFEAQLRMAKEKAERATKPGTPEWEQYQADMDAKRVEELGRYIGGEKFRQALKADPNVALGMLSQHTGRTIPELAVDFARLGLDFRNYDARIMGRRGGMLTGEMNSPYDEFNAILAERFKAPIVTSKKPRGKPSGEDY